MNDSNKQFSNSNQAPHGINIHDVFNPPQANYQIPLPAKSPKKPKKPQFRWFRFLFMLFAIAVFVQLLSSGNVPVLSPIISMLLSKPSFFTPLQFEVFIWSAVFILFVSKVFFWARRNRIDSRNDSNEE